MPNAPDDAPKLTPAQRAVELSRPWVLLAIYVALGADDLAILRGPFHILTLRLDALRIAPRTRAVQAIETLATLALLAGAVALYRVSGRAEALVYWGIAAGISGLMPIWAAYLPHRLAAQHPAVRAAGLRR